MRLYCSFFSIIIGSVLLGCKTEQELKDKWVEKINVELIQEVGVKHSPFIVDSTEYVILETKEDVLLSGIEKIRVTDDILYILNSGSNSGVYAFSDEGKYLFSINNKGKGPEEFLNINGFYVYKNMLVLYDPQNKRLSYFDRFKGNFLSSSKAPFLARELEFADGYYYVNSINQGKDKTTLLDVYDKSIKYLRDEFDGKSYNFKGNQLIKNSDDVYWIDNNLCDLYQLNRGRVQGKIDLDFGKYNLTEDELLKWKKPPVIRKSNRAFGLLYTCINSKYIFGMVSIKDKGFKVICDRLNKKGICYDPFKAKELSIFMEMKTIDEQFLYSTMSGNRFKEYLEYLESKNISIYNVKGDIKEVNFNSNPVIIKQKLK